MKTKTIDENNIKEINCGERNIQKGFRLAIQDICERHGIREGDAVEVSIKIVKKD